MTCSSWIETEGDALCNSAILVRQIHTLRDIDGGERTKHDGRVRSVTDNGYARILPKEGENRGEKTDIASSRSSSKGEKERKESVITGGRREREIKFAY
jgi:nitroimidazol reductase NimA-like FMN-containing flavoprotein (pyridoxamine 5'-phosphate oxidase superfamily)